MDTAFVIEVHKSDGVEWLVSFDGHNPRREFCFAIASDDDGAEAFRVQEMIESYVQSRLSAAEY